MNSRPWRAGGWAVLAGAAAALAAAGYWLLFTTFMVYDDEGYVLYSLKNYGLHGHLYDRVFSQYGPFFFAFYDALHRILGFAWTNTNGRLLTLAHWILTAGFCGAIAWRATRSVAATAFAYIGVFTVLWVMINEPSHPGGPIGCFVALAAFLGARTDPSRSRGGAAAIGAIGAAVALTKINVGAFLLFSSFAWIVLRLDARAWRERAGLLLAAWLVAMPWILMQRMLETPGTWRFAAICNLATVGGVAVIARSPRSGGGTLAVLGSFLGGAAAVTLATLLVTLARGTTPQGFLAGVLLDPLNQPNVFSYAVPWQPGAIPVAFLALLLALWSAFRPDHPVTRPLVLGARLAAALGFALALLALAFKSPADFGLSYGISLAALCAGTLRQDEDGRRDARVRQWLAIVLLFQSLHAYPVAGTQVNWATFLWVPLLALAVRDAALAWVAPAAWKLPGWALPFAGGAVAWGLCGFMTFKLVEIGWDKRHQGGALELPGAERIRPPDNTAWGLRIMAENARFHGSLLYSLPGLYSFNLWTGLPTPTLDNATQWFLSLSPERQHAILEGLKANPRAALIVQRDTLEYLVEHGFRVRGELGGFLGQSFERAFEVDGYAFWVHRGRRVAPLSTGRAIVDPLANRTRLELVLAAPGRRVARAELSSLLSVPRTHLATLGPGTAVLAAAPLDETGKALRLETPVAWSQPLVDPIAQLSIEFDGRLEQASQVLVRLLDAEGVQVAAVRLLP